MKLELQQERNTRLLIEKYIGTPTYDEEGAIIWANSKAYGKVQLLDVRGFSTISHMFVSEQAAEGFQNEIGKFIVDAINEKVQRQIYWATKTVQRFIIVEENGRPVVFEDVQLCYCENPISVRSYTREEAEDCIRKTIAFRTERNYDIGAYYILPFES
jgi:hypothetical protein